MRKPVLQVSDLTVSYRIENLRSGSDTRSDTSKVVQNVSFDLYRGEILGIVGESGAGKSTIGNAILDLLKKNGTSEGNIVLDGTHLNSLSHEQKRKIRGSQIGVIVQDPFSSLNPILSIAEHFRETLKKGSVYDKNTFEHTVFEALRNVELPASYDFIKRYSFQISGGQSQRVIIALSLLLNPKILIADEPTTALDVSVQEQILILIKRLVKKYNMAMILITHNMGVVYKIADTIMVMNQSYIVESQNPRELFIHPREEYTKGLIKSLPPVDKTVNKLYSKREWSITHNSEHMRFLINTTSSQDVRIPNILECNNINFSVPIPNALNIRQQAYGFISKIPLLRASIHKSSHKNDKQKPDTHTIVNNVSFTIKRGGTLGIIGESGSGKTTIANLIIGLYRRPSGVVYNGRTLSAHEIVPEIQMIFQSPYSSLNPKKTLRSVFAEAFKIKDPHISKQEIVKKSHTLLDIIALETISLNKYPQGFSGGQLQRICIARALALQPTLLLCDEPTSALDVSVQADILNLLKLLQQEFNLSMLFISHDLPVVRYMCDTIAVLKDGAIMEMQERERLFNTPQHEYTKELINLIPSIPSIVEK